MARYERHQPDKTLLREVHSLEELARPDEASWNRHGWLGACLLVLLAPLLFPLYTQNPLVGAAPETLSSGLTALSIARSGDVDLNEFIAPTASIPPIVEYAFPRRGDLVLTVEPLAAPITFAPFLLADDDFSFDANRARAINRRFLPIGNRVAAQLATRALTSGRRERRAAAVV